MTKRLTIDDLLSSGKSDNFIIEQDKKGKPRVIRKNKCKPCGCEPFQVCQLCFEQDESENDVEKDIIEYCDRLPCCKVTKTSTTGRKKGKTWIKAKKSERKGKGDLTICYHGFYIETEVKKPGEGVQGKDQKIQEKDTLEALGQYWLVVSLKEFINNLNQFTKLKGINHELK